MLRDASSAISHRVLPTLPLVLARETLWRNMRRYTCCLLLQQLYCFCNMQHTKVLQGCQDGLQRQSRAKRTRETAMLADEQPLQPCAKPYQQSCSFLPVLPEDLYVAEPEPCSQSQRLLARHLATTKKFSCSVLKADTRPQLQQSAAILAFRPNATEGQCAYPVADNPTASAPHCQYPTAADASNFVTALFQEAHAANQRQTPVSAELPFPGMHSLDLSTHLARPALWEAVQHVVQQPGSFLSSATCCSLSQV